MANPTKCSNGPLPPKNENYNGACRLCGNETMTIFNIKLTAIFVCEDCANAITRQQVIDLTSK